ncbi:hypothetical protein ACP4OV_023860 [Aristida adscensionis]
MAVRPALILCVLLLLLVPSSSQLVFNLQGKVYPDGNFYITVNVGNPPREYNLDVDTGSSLTWLQCHTSDRNRQTWPQPHPLYQLQAEDMKLPGTDPLCTALVGHPGNPRDKCAYHIAYTEDHHLVISSVICSLSLIQGPKISPSACGYYQAQVHPQAVDGIVGLGRGSRVPLISQLLEKNVINRNVFGHCISSTGVGFLFLGDYQYPSAQVSWVPINPNEENGHYSPEVRATLYFNGKVISEQPMKVVFDSGSTNTYFDVQPYQAIENAVIASLDRSLRASSIRGALSPFHVI